MKFVRREESYFCKPVPKEVRDPYVYNLKETADFVKTYLAEHPGCRVTIVGDYDSDGINATAIMYWCFAKLGIEPVMRLPHRFSEGYGLSDKIIDEIPDGLLITVDNGIAASDAVQKAKEKGLCVVVTDHHLPSVDSEGQYVLPPADIILDPHIAPEKSEFADYCGAALAYRFAREMHPNLKLKSLQVLAAIATVTDVMPIVGANHTLVKDGLKNINKRNVVPGLDILLTKLRCDDHIDEGDFGFLLGPVFNAAGRMRDNGAEDVLKLLISKKGDPRSPYKADRLIQTNEQRKELVKQSVAIAESVYDGSVPIVLYNETYSEGIIGIIAGQFTEKYYAPSVVFTKSEKPGVLKGSARSIPEINLKACLDKMQDKMLGYGGHPGAAGLSIEESRLDEFKEAFRIAVGEIPSVDTDIVYYDEELTDDVKDLEAAIEKLNLYAPFGEENPKPVFHLILHVPNAASKFYTMGDGSHFRLDAGVLSVIGFGMSEQFIQYGYPEHMECTGYLYEDWWNGKKSFKFELTAFEPIG